MYHVFVVNDITFKYHLEYLFAGTCALTDPIFLTNTTYVNSRTKETGLTSKQELNICEMVADVSRIRPGDKILFYLTQTSQHEGLFFGVFTARETAFFDSNTDNYLFAETGLNLNFRVRLLPLEVFPIGLTEREALDSLKGISHPSQMCWSMIYRKLKGKRGCTMLTDYEGDRLVGLIRNKNTTSIQVANFTFDATDNKIKGCTQSRIYRGSTLSIDILPRMITKANNTQHKYEAHLQAYVLQHLDEAPLATLLGIMPNVALWRGNEVSCGVGMQSIDIMTQQVSENNVYINILELKCVDPYTEIIDRQLPKYIDWVADYIVPLYEGKNVHIIPFVIAKSNNNLDFIEKCNNFSYYTSTTNVDVSRVKYIGYTIDSGIHFTEVN